MCQETKMFNVSSKSVLVGLVVVDGENGGDDGDDWKEGHGQREGGPGQIYLRGHHSQMASATPWALDGPDKTGAQGTGLFGSGRRAALRCGCGCGTYRDLEKGTSRTCTAAPLSSEVRTVLGYKYLARYVPGWGMGCGRVGVCRRSLSHRVIGVGPGTETGTRTGQKNSSSSQAGR